MTADTRAMCASFMEDLRERLCGERTRNAGNAALIDEANLQMASTR
ncbi:hypothetical protein ACPOL_0925 [Acidisarcina polymorpha]|uniref:Uncharacterized protein n=1 Tax=Acidisarcina polymorpha TaxID=2211140 RepID=A0A2Z5FTZ7_9BACT|nr:hypothetical protein ACPOL_0925 [Acidisarcina polymorpha]